MNLILDKASSYGLNQRQFTDKDFFEICESESVEVIWSDAQFSWYMTFEYEPYIVLPKKARGLRLLFKMFHELGHHLVHHGKAPNQAFFHGLNDSKAEREADAIALMALLPLSDLHCGDTLDGSRYARTIYRDRLRLYFLYGI